MHSDLSNGPNLPHYLGILNAKKEVEGPRRNKYEQERGRETKDVDVRERMHAVQRNKTLWVRWVWA